LRWDCTDCLREIFFEKTEEHKLLMSFSNIGRLLMGFAGLCLSFAPGSALACAACFGKSDSSLAKGMNWGIASLLVVVIGVLSGIASFFVYIARKSAMADASMSGNPAESTKRIQ
jgi:hypothetical protein